MSADFARSLTELAVFGELLDDPVYQAFCKAVSCKGTDCERVSIADFARRLYSTGSEDWTDYVRTQTLCARTCLVGGTRGQKELPERMLSAAMYELSLLSHAAMIGPEWFDHETPWKWAARPVDLQADYLNRLMEIENYGTGVFARADMFRLRTDHGVELVPVVHHDTTTFDSLYGYALQHQAIIENTEALVCSLPASNLLLYGDAGTGKSASIKAVANLFCRKGVRLVEAGKDQLAALPELLEVLADEPLKFIVYIDDLSFCEQDDSFAALKAVLEGSVCARPDNVVIYATSNRRHLVKESMSARSGDDVHRRDTLQETLSLSQRFGQCLFFQRPDKEEYLATARRIAREFGLYGTDEAFEREAESFALSQGGRSARCARQFVSMYYARKGIKDAQS